MMLKTVKSKIQSQSLFQTLNQKTSNFRQNNTGVAAIEFALIAPIMISIYFGLAEIASAINVDRKVSHTANVVGDLATQVTTVPNDDVAEIFEAALRVLDIREIGDVTIELTSYQLDINGNPETLGTATLNAGASALPDIDPVNIDDRILTPTTGVVVARIGYDYTPLKLRFTDSDINLNELFLLKPRRSATVTIGDDINTPVACTVSPGVSLSCS